MSHCSARYKKKKENTTKWKQQQQKMSEKEINRFLAKPHLLTKRLSHTENPPLFTWTVCHLSPKRNSRLRNSFGRMLYHPLTSWWKSENLSLCSFLPVIVSTEMCCCRSSVLFFLLREVIHGAAPVFFEVKGVQWNRYLSQLGASSCEMMRIGDMIMFDDEVFFVSLGD